MPKAIEFLERRGRNTGACEIKTAGPYKFGVFRGIDVAKPCDFTWFGGIHGPKPSEFIGCGGLYLASAGITPSPAWLLMCPSGAYLCHRGLSGLARDLRSTLGIRPSPSGMVVGAAGATQKSEIDDFLPAPKPCLKNPGLRQNWGTSTHWGPGGLLMCACAPVCLKPEVPGQPRQPL